MQISSKILEEYSGPRRDVLLLNERFNELTERLHMVQAQQYGEKRKGWLVDIGYLVAKVEEVNELYKKKLELLIENGHSQVINASFRLFNAENWLFLNSYITIQYL